MKIKIAFVSLMACIMLTSCAGAPVKHQDYMVNNVVAPNFTGQSVIPSVAQSFPRQDTVHVVGPSETLWRIGKMYDVKIDDITRANKLKSSSKLEMGQRLLIPKAAQIKPFVSLYPSNKWKYIIAHHSATDEGTSLFFRKFHLSKGWKEIGYHFVIDNGTMGRVDGQVEVAPRWIKQQTGAHCNASGMNQKAIGICLVGNFSKDKVSDKQMDSLVYLVNLLRKYYNIPINNIIGHGRVAGAKTECPGKYFSWGELKMRLRQEGTKS